MGTTLTVIPRDGVTSHGVTVGMGSNADGNTAVVKCETSERCLSLAGRTLAERRTLPLVTLLTACCSCMDCKLYSFSLEMDPN